MCQEHSDLGKIKKMLGVKSVITNKAYKCRQINTSWEACIAQAIVVNVIFTLSVFFCFPGLIFKKYILPLYKREILKKACGLCYEAEFHLILVLSGLTLSFLYYEGGLLLTELYHHGKLCCKSNLPFKHNWIKHLITVHQILFRSSVS